MRKKMDLKSYIESAPGNATALAKALNIAPSYLSQMASGTRGVSALRALAIEKQTGGAVTRADLLPEIYRKLWPEWSPPNSRKGNEERRKTVRRESNHKNKGAK